MYKNVLKSFLYIWKYMKNNHFHKPSNNILKVCFPIRFSNWDFVTNYGIDFCKIVNNQVVIILLSVHAYNNKRQLIRLRSANHE